MSDFICTKTRETRANNPFGVSKSRIFNFENVVGVDNEMDDELLIFKAFQDGMNAALWLLRDYFRRGINTPINIYNEWTGDGHDKAKARGDKSNGEKLAQIMKVNPTIVLEFVLKDMLLLCQAMLRFEDSTKVFESDLKNIPNEMYQEAIEYANSRFQQKALLEQEKPQAIPAVKKMEVVMPQKFDGIDWGHIGLVVGFSVLSALGIHVSVDPNSILASKSPAPVTIIQQAPAGQQ